MSPKYYVQTDEDSIIPDGDIDTVLYWDHPFDTLDEAKAWAKANPGEGIVTIYECRDNLITPILETWDAENGEFEEALL